MKQEVKIDFLHFMEDIRGLNHVLITMSSLNTINWNFLVFKNIFHSSNLKKIEKITLKSIKKSTLSVQFTSKHKKRSDREH